jgi:hypothetical protein
MVGGEYVPLAEAATPREKIHDAELHWQLVDR